MIEGVFYQDRKQRGDYREMMDAGEDGRLGWPRTLMRADESVRRSTSKDLAVDESRAGRLVSSRVGLILLLGF